MHVNIGEPILLAEVLDQFDPHWRKRALEDDARLPWVNPAVDVLAERIMRNINAAAAVTPINLLAVDAARHAAAGDARSRTCCGRSICTSRCCAACRTAIASP